MDRLFNLLKLSYHRLNVYTYDMLMNIVNQNDFITAHKVKPEEMLDFLTWQDIYYRTPEGGEFKTTHVFEIAGTIYGSAPTLLKKWDYDGADLRTDNLLPTKRNRKCRYMPSKERKAAIARMANEIKVLTSPGLRDIKAVELYTKWGPLIPEWVRESTCPRPSDEVILAVKNNRKEKAHARTRRKRVHAAIEETKSIEEGNTQIVPVNPLAITAEEDAIV